MFLSDLIKVAWGHSNFVTLKTPPTSLITTPGRTNWFPHQKVKAFHGVDGQHACGKWWGRDIYSPVQRLYVATILYTTWQLLICSLCQHVLSSQLSLHHNCNCTVAFDCIWRCYDEMMIAVSTRFISTFNTSQLQLHSWPLTAEQAGWVATIAELDSSGLP